MENHSEERNLPRLDPFVFPTETTIGFALLIVTIISASIYLYQLLYWRYGSTQIVFETLFSWIETCKSTSPLSSSKCIAPYNTDMLKAAWFSMICVGILVSFAGLFYSLFPIAMMRQEGMVSLEKQAGTEEVMVYLQDLCQEVGIKPPRFLQKPIVHGQAQAFGAFGRYYVVLPIGLKLLFKKDRDKFRAIMLHELSHLRNQDVDKIYFSVAIIFAFVIVAMVPGIISLWGFSSSLFQVLWRVIALILIVYLTFTSLVRSRELYADVRASTYAGSEALGLLFQAAPKSKFSGLQSIIISILEQLPYFKRNRWQFAFLFHPDPSERHQVVETTDRLFYLDTWTAFTTGITLTIAYRPISTLINTFSSYLPKDNNQLTIIFLIKGFIFASLVVGILGVRIWRQTFVTIVRHQNSAEAGKLGIALGVGTILGRLFSLSSNDSSSEYHLTIFTLFANVLLITSLYYIFRWIALGALLWLQVAIYSQSPRPFYTAGLFVAGFYLTLLFGAIFGIWDLLALTHNATLAFSNFRFFLVGGIMHFALSPLTCIALVSVWAFPASAGFWHKHQPDSPSVPRWGFLDRQSDRFHPPPRKQLEVYSVLKTGLIGGCIFCGLLLVLRSGIHILIPESVRNSEWFIISILTAGQYALAVLMQAGTAIKVAITVESFQEVQGLFAAFIAGCVMSVSVFIFNLLFGGSINVQVVWIVFSSIVNSGALLSLMGIIMVRLPKKRATVAPCR